VVRERLHGAFQRTVNINVPVEADEIEATFDRGVLTITLPKAEEAKLKTIQVTAAAS
jgi:HSP20 family protein